MTVRFSVGGGPNVDEIVVAINAAATKHSTASLPIDRSARQYGALLNALAAAWAITYSANRTAAKA